MEGFNLTAVDFLNYDNEMDTFRANDDDSVLHRNVICKTEINGPSSTFASPCLNEAPSSQGKPSALINGLPLDLSSLFKLGVLKDEIPYIVKYKIYEGKQVKVWQCKTCSKEFGHQYTLMRHLPTHTDERKFACNTCGKAFRQMSTLSQHRAIHSQERPYVCEMCQKTFNRVSTLISHRKTHTGIKPYQCHLCSKAFHQKGNLRNHIFTHTNERPYKCDDCGKGFNQMSNLMCHKSKAHQEVDNPKYHCQICGRTFNKRISLRNHEQYDHKVKNIPIDVPAAEDAKIANAIFVEPIKTKAMQLAMESNQIPFALLRPLTGIPVLVKVLPTGNEKQMLVPASADDLKKHGDFYVTPKVASVSPDKEAPVTALDSQNLVGSTVRIKIPVVATVIQQSTESGQLSMSVVSPGPEDQSIEQINNSNNSENSNTFIVNSENGELLPEDILE